MKKISILIFACSLTFSAAAQNQFKWLFLKEFTATSSVANTYVVDIPQILLAKDVTFKVKFPSANTSNVFLNVSGTGNKNLFKEGGSLLDPDDIKANQIITISYDGSSFYVLGGASGGSGGTVPDATSSVKGKAKLYTSGGSNTDGSMDQNSITSSINGRAPGTSGSFPLRGNGSGGFVNLVWPTSGQLIRSTGIDYDNSGISSDGTTATFGAVPNFPSQTANKVFASPNGSSGVPGFRSLVIADISGLVSSQWITTSSDIYYNTGKVMIGTNAAPSFAKLQTVETSSSATRGVVFSQYSTDGNSSRVFADKARGTFASPSVITSGDFLGNYTFRGHDGTNFINAAEILATSTGTISTGIVQAALKLRTANSSGTMTDALTVDGGQIVTFNNTPIFSSGIGSATATTQSPGTSNGTVATTLYCDLKNLTMGAGVHNTSGTLTADLSTGISGGQSVIGGTTSGNITIKSNNSGNGNIVIGASSYSEANNTISWILNTQGSSMGGSWTGTASGQDHFIMNPTITGRSNGGGGNTDVYNLFEIGGSFVVGSGTSAQVARSLYFTSTFPVGMQGRELISSNPTWSTTGSADYLVHLQSASSDRFRIRYNGDLFQSGTTADFTGSSTIALRSPASTFSNSGTNVDVIVFNTAGTKSWRHRATNVDVYTFNDGTNDIFTVSGAQWQFNRSVRFPIVQKTGSYTLTSADLGVEVTSGTNTQTLPTAASVAGLTYYITNSGSGVVTVATTSSQTFVNISGTPTTLTLNQFQGAMLFSNGTGWLKVSSF